MKPGEKLTLINAEGDALLRVHAVYGGAMVTVDLDLSDGEMASLADGLLGRQPVTITGPTIHR